jgi:hypothetical protein
MVASIAESLLAYDLSVEQVNTELRRGKGGRLEFSCEADCVANSYMDHDHIEAMVRDLSHLKEKLDLDIVDVRVQRLKVEKKEGKVS